MNFHLVLPTNVICHVYFMKCLGKFQCCQFLSDESHQNDNEGCAQSHADRLQASFCQREKPQKLVNCKNPWAHTFMVLSVSAICIWEWCHLAMIDCLSATMLLQVFPALASLHGTHSGNQHDAVRVLFW